MANAEIPAGLRLPRTGGCPETHHLAQERAARLRAAVSRLPARCGALFAALLDDPTADYAALAARLGIPRGSIGPTRSRCLECLRRRLGPDI
ncbi:RNA polymerase sigma factor [Streptacidiphilus anmyonensis]|uniref:RNA polymerase sigma factor n=1 Tax=Streptacidiphilus anmyonensis TaxID=405782 RepID=UPI0006948B8A|nr:sigma-70 family RNA polymerase sigma factor [Streptacidiphilus anmyonensis]